MAEDIAESRLHRLGRRTKPMGLWDGIFTSKAREYTLVILFFLLLAVIFTWPLILHIHDGVIGGHGDPLLNTWIVSWDARTIFTNPTGLFQGNILYPATDVLTYSEHMFTIGLMAAPVYYISGNPILAYNTMVFLGLVLSSFGCYLLIKKLTGSRWGALVGGVYFGLCPYKISQLNHLHIVFSAFLPFMLLYLYGYLEEGGIKNLVLFGVFFLLQSLASWHYLVYGSILILLLWVWKAAFSRTREEWMRIAGAVAMTLIAAALMLPFALPYLRVHARLPDFVRTLEESARNSAALADYLNVLPQSVLYRAGFSPLRVAFMGSETILFPGLVILLLAACGVFLRGRGEDECASPLLARHAREPYLFLIVTVVGVLLSLGPKIGGISNPLYTVPYHLGLFKLIRWPPRFFVLVSLGLAVLSGFGVAKISQGLQALKRPRISFRLVCAILLLAIVVEAATFNFEVTPVPVYDEVPEVYTWLKDQDAVAAIEIPASFPAPNPQGLFVYLSTYHWKRIANGYSGYNPPVLKELYEIMPSFPSGDSVDLLREYGIDFVIWHRELLPPQQVAEYDARLMSQPGLSLVRDFGEEVVFRVDPAGAGKDP
ncbi:MAG: hypothetical protein C4536_06210 [Actinobacteria bacterium]|nr:MAG: hypothetical protein C4536_06210 [Actinomycetota bacterium]